MHPDTVDAVDRVLGRDPVALVAAALVGGVRDELVLDARRVGEREPPLVEPLDVGDLDVVGAQPLRPEVQEPSGTDSSTSRAWLVPRVPNWPACAHGNVVTTLDGSPSALE